ncbi:MAG: N-acetyl-alpha-D-glucosaminyl L-malate synthase BshA [Flavobacteriales bacterium]
MKIGIVCYPTYGGSGVVATELGKALAAQGHIIHFITYSQPVRLDEFNSNIFFHEVLVSEYALFQYEPYEVVLTSKMVDVAKHEGLDLLHVHYAIPHASAAYMAKQILKEEGIHLPVITTLHGTDITLVGKDPSFEPVISFSITNSDAVTAVSDSLKQDTYKHFKTKKAITVIPNFVNLEKYKVSSSGCTRSNFAAPDEKILIHISNFRKVKRVDDVIKIFQKVRSKVKSKLILVGDGPERYAAEQLSRQLGVHNDVKVVGKLKNVEEVLCVADLFLLPSEHESFGLAALESMAAGTPVVSSNTGGIPEVNIHGATGFLADVGDVEAMADFAIQILLDENLLKEMSANARKRSVEFSLENVLPKYLDLYRSLLSK